MGKRKWWLLAAILWMVVIFIFTQLPLSTGENTSGAIEEIVKTEHVSGVGHSGIETINLMVRKSTHVLTFGFLAFYFGSLLNCIDSLILSHGFLPYCMR